MVSAGAAGGDFLDLRFFFLLCLFFQPQLFQRFLPAQSFSGRFLCFDGTDFRSSCFGKEPFCFRFGLPFFFQNTLLLCEPFFFFQTLRFRQLLFFFLAFCLSNPFLFRKPLFFGDAFFFFNAPFFFQTLFFLESFFFFLQTLQLCFTNFRKPSAFFLFLVKDLKTGFGFICLTRRLFSGFFLFCPLSFEYRTFFFFSFLRFQQQLFRLFLLLDRVVHTLFFLFSAQCDCGDFRFNLLRMLQSRSFLVSCLTDRFLFLADSSLTRSFFFA